MDALGTVALTGEVIIDKIAVCANRVLQSELTWIWLACLVWCLIGILIGANLS